MRLTPRRDEVAEVAALLDEQHESAEACAKAVIKLCADLMQDRDLVAAVLSYGDHALNLGPFGNEAEAKAFVDKLAPSAEVRLVPLMAPGPLAAGMDGKKGSKGHCKSCGFAQWAHELEGNTRGKNVLPATTCTGWEAQ